MKSLIMGLAALGVLLLDALGSAEAHRLRCGSSWELCAQRGKGPGARFQQQVQPQQPRCTVKKGCR
jgi:hypothetical protein